MCTANRITSATLRLVMANLGKIIKLTVIVSYWLPTHGIFLTYLYRNGSDNIMRL